MEKKALQPSFPIRLIPKQKKQATVAISDLLLTDMPGYNYCFYRNKDAQLDLAIAALYFDLCQWRSAAQQ